MIPLGLSSMVTELSSAAALAAFNLIILAMAGNTGVAAYGVVANLALVELAVFVGIAQGMQPLVSRRRGMGDLAGCRALLCYGALFSLGAASLAYGAVFMWAREIAALFNQAGDRLLAAYAEEGLRIYFAGFFFGGLNVVTAAFFSAAEMPKRGFLISSLRAFLLALLHHTHTQAQIEYTLGFLCHYAADTVMHPYVVFVSSPGQPYGMKGGHGYFEIALDSTLHAEDTGVSEVPADDSSPVPVGQDLAEIAALLHQCILEVYGQDISVEALADSFYYTYRLRRLFTSRHGVRRAFYWVLELFFGGRGFITGHVSPAHLKLNLPEDWTDPATGEERHGGAFALLKDAQHRCELFMTAALGHWMGKLDEEILEKTLGSMSYITGTETEQSKSQQVPDAEQAGETA